MLHGFTSSHDGDTADFALELDSIIGAASDRGGDCVLHNRKMVETLFDKESDDSVGIEDEIGTDCFFISYLTRVVAQF